ncbi:hypothetical protein KY330_04700 [Candidatus Woesearchaeota archaeon]|nr:hypothetical protein [Candidatus Woesearchaeota archaeon]
MSIESYRDKKLDLEKSVKQGWQYLESNHCNGHFPSYISASREMANSRISPYEIFSTIVIADTILKDQPENKATRSVLQFIENQRVQASFTFYKDRAICPPDTDTNALGYSLLLEAGSALQKDAHLILDTILNHRDKNGLV